MRTLLVGILLLLSATYASVASASESERFNPLQSTLPSPLDEVTSITVTSSCEEIDVSQLDQSNGEIQYALQQWGKRTNKLIVRRYQLVFEPRSGIEGRAGVKIKLSDAGHFSPYKLSIGDFTLHVSAGSKLIMSFISPHPPRWVTSYASVRFAVEDRMSEWIEEPLQMLLPSWTHHVYEGTRFE